MPDQKSQINCTECEINLRQDAIYLVFMVLVWPLKINFWRYVTAAVVHIFNFQKRRGIGHISESNAKKCRQLTISVTSGGQTIRVRGIYNWRLPHQRDKDLRVSKEVCYFFHTHWIGFKIFRQCVWNCLGLDIWFEECWYMAFFIYLCTPAVSEVFVCWLKCIEAVCTFTYQLCFKNIPIFAGEMAFFYANTMYIMTLLVFLHPSI